MKFAYLMNMYPMTSTTFIRREIREMEKSGIQITRYAIRHWPEELVDPEDTKEQEQTTYLLSGNLLGLLLTFFLSVVMYPREFFRAFQLWWKVLSQANSQYVQHVAYLMHAVYLFRQTKKDRISHIHAHFSTNSTTVAMLCRKMGGPSYSFTAHGPDEFDAPVHSSINEKVAHASFVVAISDFCKSQLTRFSSFDNWDKIHVFRCGVSLDELEMSDCEFENNHTFVCVGRLTDLKGQLLLPKITKRLIDQYPNLKIILIGDGPSRSQLETQIKANDLGGVIELRGWQTNDEVKQAIQTSRALILPSFAEGLPIVFMEALALGRPVLATYIAGIPELVDEDCGWIIPAGSEQALEKAMAEILSSTPEILAQKARVGRQRIEDQHNIEQLAENLASEFRRTADGK